MDRKPVFIIGLVTYSLLLLLSVVFFMERSVFLDIAFHLFYILKDESFAIQNHRIAAVFTQAFPLLGAKFGFTLKQISLVYSASFIILYSSVFFSIILFLKNTRMALIMLFFSILMVSHTFFWIQSELPQGMAFLLLFMAFFDNQIQRKETPLYYYPLAVILIGIVCFTHPLLIFPFLFMLLFFALQYPNWKKFISIHLGIYFLAFGIKSIFFKTPYESQAMGGLKNIFTLFPNYLDIPSNINFIGYLITDYYFLPLLFISIVFFYLKSKQHLKLLLCTLFIFGFLFMVNCSYPQGADQFYLENQYLILSIFVSVPFVFDILPKIKSKKLFVLLICLICGIGIFRIYSSSDIYQQRLLWQKGLLEKTAGLEHKKMIIPDEAVPSELLFMNWGSPYEFWLLSTIESGVSRSILIEDEENEFDNQLNNNKHFVTKWGVFEYQFLNPSPYFNFTDTSNYKIYEKIPRE